MSVECMQVINIHALLPVATLQSPIYLFSGVPVGSQVQNQQKFFDPDDGSQSATTVGGFSAFSIHRWQDRWLDIRSVAAIELEVIQFSLVQMSLCRQCSITNMLVRWTNSSVGGQSFFLNKCDFISDAKVLLWWRKWIENYCLNSVINTLRERTSFLCCVLLLLLSELEASHKLL